MKYLSCGGCGRLLAAVIPEEPNKTLVLKCPNEGNGYEHTTITFALSDSRYVSDGHVHHEYGSGPGEQDIR